MLNRHRSISVEEAAESFYAEYESAFADCSRRYLMPYLRRLAGDLLRMSWFRASDLPSPKELLKILPDSFYWDERMFGALSFIEDGKVRWCAHWNASEAQMQSHLGILKKELEDLQRSTCSYEVFFCHIQRANRLSVQFGPTCGDALKWLSENAAKWDGSCGPLETAAIGDDELEEITDDELEEMTVPSFAAQQMPSISDGGDWQ